MSRPGRSPGRAIAKCGSPAIGLRTRSPIGHPLSMRGRRLRPGHRPGVRLGRCPETHLWLPWIGVNWTQVSFEAAAVVSSTHGSFRPLEGVRCFIIRGFSWRVSS